MEHADTRTARPGAFHALRTRDFRLLWSAQAVSLVGDAAFLTALGWRTFTLAGAGKLGLVLVCQSTAMLATVLIGGALADRFSRRRMMITSDLARMVADGRFRSDLYYRLNVFPVTLPPLRDRRDDIPRLVRHFANQFARRLGRQIETIPTAVMEALVRYSWPGNIRELRNIIERGVILSRGETLVIPDLNDSAEGAGHPNSLEEVERALVELAMRQSNNNQTQAAKLLDISRDALRYKLKKFGLMGEEAADETETKAV